MFSLTSFIQAAGYIGVGAVIFAESGLLIGFFLPGDSLLFTAGLLASQGYLNIFILVTVTFLCAVFGDNVGYAIGKKFGPKVFTREKSFWFHPDHVKRANIFFEKYGAKTIILARFLPVVRTLAPVLAGIGEMKYRTFLFNNILGGLLWAVGVTLVGFYLGKVVPNIDQYLIPIIIFIIALSLSPTVLHVLRDEGQRKYLKEQVARALKKVRKL